MRYQRLPLGFTFHCPRPPPPAPAPAAAITHVSTSGSRAGLTRTSIENVRWRGRSPQQRVINYRQRAAHTSIEYLADRCGGGEDAKASVAAAPETRLPAAERPTRFLCKPSQAMPLGTERMGGSTRKGGRARASIIEGTDRRSVGVQQAPWVVKAKLCSITEGARRRRSISLKPTAKRDAHRGLLAASAAFTGDERVVILPARAVQVGCSDRRAPASQSPRHVASGRCGGVAMPRTEKPPSALERTPHTAERAIMREREDD